MSHTHRIMSPASRALSISSHTYPTACAVGYRYDRQLRWLSFFLAHLFSHLSALYHRKISAEPCWAIFIRPLRGLHNGFPGRNSNRKKSKYQLSPVGTMSYADAQRA